MYKSNYEGTLSVTLGGTVSVNTLAKVGNFVGMYLKGGVVNDVVAFLIEGLIKGATKVGSQAWTAGDALYWDEANSRFTKVQHQAEPIAIAAADAGNGAGVTTGDVILLGVPLRNPTAGAASVAAAGSAQGDATALTAMVNTISAADGTKGVKLPAAEAGKRVLVYNEHASNGLKVYPATGDDINDGTADAAVTIEGKTLAIFEALDATTWAAIFTANT